MKQYKTKDSGKRKVWDSGFNRDTDEGKLRYDLIPTELLERLAGLYTRGAEKYDDNNWKIAKTEEEINRFKQSGWRHWMQWLKGDQDEDHAIAVIWNLIAYEWHTQHKNENNHKTKKSNI